MISDPPQPDTIGSEFNPTTNLQFMRGSDEIVARDVEVALMAWAGAIPSGKIKFNLEGLNQMNQNRSVRHVTTLKELKRVAANPMLAPRTRYFLFSEAGQKTELVGSELLAQLTTLAPFLQQV